MLAGVVGLGMCLPPPSVHARVHDTPASVADESGQVTTIATATRGDPIERARTTFNEAKARYIDAEFGEAGELFLKSFEIYPSLEALYGAANSFEQSGEILIALELYDRYFTYVDEHPTRPAAAQHSYRTLNRLVGRVDIEVAAGTKFEALQINGKPYSPEELPIRVLPGVVRVEFIGAESWQREALDTEVLAGATAVFKFTGFRRPAPKPEPPDVKPDEPDKPRTGQVAKGVFWAGVGMTAASAIAAATLGGLTMREKRLYEQELGMTPYPGDHEANFERYREVTNVLIGVTAGLTAFTIVSGVIALAARRRAKPKVSWTPRGLRF